MTASDAGAVNAWGAGAVAPDAGAVRSTDDGTAVTVEAAGVELLRYVYPGDPERGESPKPYLHPLRTLAGDIVTGYRPHDHRWHKGLQMTASHLSGDNFWGGGSYRREQGRYVDLDNHGTMRHDGFDAVADGRIAERLCWLSSAGEPWLTERRLITATVLDDVTWELSWRTELTGLRAEPLRFGSPTTAGRPLAGYSGLTWRGPRSFTGGEVLGPRVPQAPAAHLESAAHETAADTTDDGTTDDAADDPADGAADGTSDSAGMMGAAAPWLAFRGTHDEVDRVSTLVFDHEQTPDGPPTHWFVRSTPFPVVNPSWAFHHEFTLSRGERLTRHYRITLATGAWDRDRVESHLRRHPIGATAR